MTIGPPVLSAVCPHLLAIGQFAARNWSWRLLRMNGTPASSPTAWRGAGKTYTCTCPDPPSLCVCPHPVCLARGEDRVQISKEDEMVLDIVISDTGSYTLQKSCALCKTDCIPQHPELFPLRLWGENILSSCPVEGFAGWCFSSVSIACRVWTLYISPIISL